MSNGRSWFYLTLWRGTPPEFTENFDTTIEDSCSKDSLIQTLESIESKISTVASLSAKIMRSDCFNADITKETEIIWYVG